MALLEVPVALLISKLKWSRVRAAVVTALGVLSLGAPVALGPIMRTAIPIAIALAMIRGLGWI